MSEVTNSNNESKNIDLNSTPNDTVTIEVKQLEENSKENTQTNQSDNNEKPAEINSQGPPSSQQDIKPPKIMKGLDPKLGGPPKMIEGMDPKLGPPGADPKMMKGMGPPPGVDPKMMKGMGPPPGFDPKMMKGMGPPPGVDPKMGGPPPFIMDPDYVAVELPRKQFIIVLISLFMALIMASLDITIVASALPIISKEFQAFNNYTWVIVAYLLAQTVIQPTTGKLTDIFGRRPMMLTMLVIFIISSLICGFSRNYDMLIAARALQGIGGGSIISMVNIIVTDIVSLRQRATYMGMVNSVFSFSSVVGPLIGGLFADTISWRWAFFINVPICIISAILIAIYVKIPTPPGSIMEKVKKIDFLGTALLIGFSVCLLLGLNWGGTNYAWSSPVIICLLLAFAVMFLAFIVVECKVAKDPIIPPKIFREKNIIISALGTFIVGFIFLTFNNTIAMLYQNARGFSATISGLRLTPSFITIAVAGIGSGILIGKFGHIKMHIIVGSALLIVSTVLISFIGLNTPYYAELGIILLYGFALGITNQNFVVVGQNSSPKPLIATTTSTILFGRTVGGVIGVALFGTLLKNKFIHNYKSLYPDVTKINMNNLASLPNYNEPYMKALNVSYRSTLVPASVLVLLLAIFVKKMTFGGPMGPGGPGGPMGPGGPKGPMKPGVPPMQAINDQVTLHDAVNDQATLQDKLSYSNNDQVTLNDNVIDMERLRKSYMEEQQSDSDEKSSTDGKSSMDQKTINDNVIDIDKLEKSLNDEKSSVDQKTINEDKSSVDTVKDEKDKQ